MSGIVFFWISRIRISDIQNNYCKYRKNREQPFYFGYPEKEFWISRKNVYFGYPK